MRKKAWQIDREIRLSAIPLDRRKYPSHWEETSQSFPQGDELMLLFWDAKVPGSGAPECVYVEMAESMANKGFDVSHAEEFLPKGMELAAKKDIPRLRVLTAEFLEALFNAPLDPNSPYHTFRHPLEWDEIVIELGNTASTSSQLKLPRLGERIYHGWLGQLAGASFGTAIEGYHGTRLREVYGEINDYIIPPETMNDDVVYELVFLDALESWGNNLTARQIALEWLHQIPFGWSAEWIALQNLRQGMFPPESGSFRNPFSDWIGAQMRGMICGMVAPAAPLLAARLAFEDARISHSANGIYGEIYAAVLTSLAFQEKELPALIKKAAAYVPQQSEYAAVLQECIALFQTTSSPSTAWQQLDQRFEQYNWIHAYPNIAAVLTALWYGEGDMTRSFALLAEAGLDVDCNGGLVGNILGVMFGVPTCWAEPLGDTLETYLPSHPLLSIRSLAARTEKLAQLVLSANEKIKQ